MSQEIKDKVLDSPLVVHKPSDASYQETANEVTMCATHTDEEAEDVPTLQRHRFRKEKKKKKSPFIFLAVIAVLVAVFTALAYNGIIPVGNKTTTESTTQRSYTTKEANSFEGIITIKSTYIFFEGEEVNGLEGLEKKIKYLPKGTKFVVQDEDADSNFLNFEVLSLLSNYNIDYDIKHIVSSGLKSKYEKPEVQIEPTDKAESNSVNTTK